MTKSKKRPALFKVAGITFAQELRELLQSMEALAAWYDELPMPIRLHLGRLERLGRTATSRRDRLDGLWSAEAWFFFDDRPDRCAAWEWIQQYGDEWLSRDPRRLPTARQAIRTAERLLRPPRD
jgi:hypothetical protein